MPSSYQVVLWKQESFVVLRPLQVEFFRNLLEAKDPHAWDKAAKRFQNQNSVTDVAEFDKDAKKQT